MQSYPNQFCHGWSTSLFADDDLSLLVREEVLEQKSPVSVHGILRVAAQSTFKTSDHSGKSRHDQSAFC